MHMYRMAKNLSGPPRIFPAEIKEGNNVLLLVSALILYISVLLMVYLVPCFLYFGVFVSDFALLKWPPIVDFSAKFTNAVMHPMKKIDVLDNTSCLCSGMSYCTVGCEFSY